MVLRLRFLLVRAVLLLLPLLCLACPAVSSVRRILDPAGVVVARPAMGPTGDRRSGQGVGLLPLVLLLAVGRGIIAHLLRKKTEPRLLLPKLDVLLEVLLAIFAPLAASWTFGLDVAVVLASGALLLGCWSSIPLAFGLGG